MPDKDITILARILESSQFQGSELYQNLLTYLFEAHQNDYVPKEISIAHDVFKKGKDFNTAENPSVRVHMHNLRNKLKLYYQSEGREDEFQLTIPKGHYRIDLVKRKPSSPKFISTNHKLLLALLVFLAISSLYLSVYTLYFQASPLGDGLPDDSQLWEHFFDNGMQNSVVIGDFLIFHEFDGELGKVRRIQDYDINTTDELERFIQTNPKRNIGELRLGELPHNSIFNIVDLQKVFMAFRNKFNISFSSEINIDYLKKRNVIYIGEFKNLRALSDLIATRPFNYQTLPNWNGVINFTQSDSLVTLRTEHNYQKSRYVVDLGGIAKLPGQNKENYLLVMGFGYDSQIKLIDMISNKTSLNKFESEIMLANNGEMPEYFFAVFKVVGSGDANTTAIMEFFQEVKADIFQNHTQLSQ